MVQEPEQKSRQDCPEPIVVSLDEAARMLSVSSRKIAYLVADGTLPSVKIDKRRLIRVEDLRRFVTDRLSVA